ncbi:HU family DNA-binding protein [Aquimixticola soesokkakensis]|nr:HU family DNA-binding protein [Aquimixticola soesokkakensis]
MRKKELLEKIVASTGARQAVVKPIVDAVLQELGEALARGDKLVLPPLGRVSVNKSKEVEDGKVYVTKVRQPSAEALEKQRVERKEKQAAKKAAEGVAETVEAS